MRIVPVAAREPEGDHGAGPAGGGDAAARRHSRRRIVTSDQDPAVVAAAMSAMEKYTGVVPGYRRAHAHGHGFVGYFEATPAVAAITVAEHLQGDRIAVVVRLSNGAGSPYAADLQSPHRGMTLGLGIEFALPSGGRATWGAPNMTRVPGQHARGVRRGDHRTTAQCPRAPQPAAAAGLRAAPSPRGARPEGPDQPPARSAASPQRIFTACTPTTSSTPTAAARPSATAGSRR